MKPKFLGYFCSPKAGLKLSNYNSYLQVYEMPYSITLYVDCKFANILVRRTC